MNHLVFKLAFSLIMSNCRTYRRDEGKIYNLQLTGRLEIETKQK